MHSPSPNVTQVRSFRAISTLVAAALLGTYAVVDISKRQIGSALYRPSELSALSHIADMTLRMKLVAQERELNMSSKNLANMTAIRQANSDPLPTHSYFGLTNASILCRGRDGNKCPAKFRPLETRLVTAPKYKISACLIQKNMSTLLRAIICYLYDERAFKAAGRLFTEECTNVRLCAWKNEFNDFQQVLRKYNVSVGMSHPWKQIAVTRHPVERFISAFVDRCVRKPRGPQPCNGCGSNMTCFVLTEYKRTMQQSRANVMERTLEDTHIFPQSWRCHFYRDLSAFEFIRYSSDPTSRDDFLQQFSEIARSAGVNQSSSDFIAAQLKSGRVVHSTVQSAARKFFEERLRSSPFLMEFVVRMYYWDFVLFGYDVPKLKFQ